MEQNEIQETNKVKNFIKENWQALATTVGTLAVTGAFYAYSAYNAHKKTESYIDSLEARTELQREALGAYKDSLDIPFNQQDEDKS